MRLPSLFSFLIVALLSFTGCRKDDGPTPAEVLFAKDWYYTGQQDVLGFLIYKPEGEFQPQGGWGIDGFRFEADGRFVLHTTGPADGPLDVPGTWQLVGKNTYFIDLSGDYSSYKLVIVSAEASTLRVRRE